MPLSYPVQSATVFPSGEMSMVWTSVPIPGFMVNSVVQLVVSTMYAAPSPPTAILDPSGENATEEYSPLLPPGSTSLQIVPVSTLTSMTEQPLHCPPQPPESSSTTAKLVLLLRKATLEKVRELPEWEMPS